ncbi:D-alanyl-D-alanine carboxypeptidase [Streptomyces sp. NBC_00237]|uniref:D-alanyl-D-alanine carboxypeptidase n=1 Tax=Streptomyces sp. NBC_00237 TaxID=2975687 RepID=UPI002258BBA0|nr:D-alanyl-D-alanine carboxypeptidase [Streptomyces sp. NBC_00237]MCX5200601.1 D-alanyl-D-alanine carboxypeptidase [Streptomyces sp. NBC_00237]
MAGESPGKSEQRKSSGETADSDARDPRGARDKKDPRLAVFRERAQGETDPVAADGADEVTHESARESARKSSQDAPGSDGKGTPAPAEGTDQPTATFRTRPRGTELPEAAAGTADAEPGAEAEAESASSDEEKPSAEPEKAPEAAESEESAGSGETPEPGDSRLRAAVAAWVATSDDPDEDTSAEGAEKEAAKDAPEAEPDPEPAAEAESSDAPDAGDAGAAKDEPKAASKADPKPGPKVESKDEQPDAGDASEEPDPEASADDDPAEPDGDTSESSAKAADPDPAPVPAKKPAPAATDGDADKDAAADKDESADDGKADDGKADDGKGVDQATAVFKTMRPTGPKVDQPTAMLKLPSEDPKGAGSTSGAKTGRKAESDAERTSKFVPLKPDDVRSPKPPRRPGETAGQPGAGQSQSRPVPPPPGPGLPEAERTKQQPLPPKPPLDLLAELTNKPAPPETPVRTTVRRFKIWTPLVLLLVVVFGVVQFVRPLPDAKLELSAAPTFTFGGGKTEMPWPGEGQSAIEVDGVGSMGTDGAQKPAPIASMAKAMTAYVILKDHPITGKETGPKITVDQAAEDDGKKGDESTAQIKKGQEYTQREMLMMLMIPSGNNVARLLGRWDAGSEEKFLEKMNAAAKDLGMTNTRYTDSSGFDKGTVSTPVDQIKLGRAVMENDIFRKIVDMPQVEIPGLPGKIYNNNKILLEPGVNGIKTGSTTPAGGNLLFTANTVIDGKERRIIGAVMNQTTGKILNEKLDKAIFDSLKLIKKAQEIVTSAAVVKKGDVVGYVDDGLGGRTPVVATKELKAIGWPGLKVDLAIGAQPGKPVPHAAKAGDVVGEVTVGTGPGKVSAPVALQSELTEPGLGAKLTRLG